MIVRVASRPACHSIFSLLTHSLGSPHLIICLLGEKHDFHLRRADRRWRDWCVSAAPFIHLSPVAAPRILLFILHKRICVLHSLLLQQVAVQFWRNLRPGTRKKKFPSTVKLSKTEIAKNFPDRLKKKKSLLHNFFYYFNSIETRHHLESCQLLAYSDIIANWTPHQSWKSKPRTTDPNFVLKQSSGK